MKDINELLGIKNDDYQHPNPPQVALTRLPPHQQLSRRGKKKKII